MTVLSENLDLHWMQIWGKTPNFRKEKTCGEHKYHPLLLHMLDVAAVAALVWDHCLSPQLRKRIECQLGNDARTQIIFLAGAHDLGKAAPGFQKKEPALSCLSGLPYSENDMASPHGFLSARVLQDAFVNWPEYNILVRISGGHHGVFPRSLDLQMGQNSLGNHHWQIARRELLEEFAGVIGFEMCSPSRMKHEFSDPGLIPILAGFVSVTDWIGSNQDFFPCVADCGNPYTCHVDAYWKKANINAQSALEVLGWIPAVSFVDEAPFNKVFTGFTPNQLQTTAIESASKETSSYLMVIEAPMGQGKTEAALYLADMAFCRGFSQGMYIAMPTQATGNAMFQRVLHDYLMSRGHRGRLNLQLVHGDALPADRQSQLQEGEISNYKPSSIDDKAADVEAQTWFTAKKRPLLAPFGVGTIDQSMLSILQTKHWFVRLFGLSGKVVIFDEVHAYDAYMNAIIERLLLWLAEIDCTVILLSATLPEAKRKALIKAYSGREDIEYMPYPRISIAMPRRFPNKQANVSPICRAIPQEKPVGVDLQAIKPDLNNLIDLLHEKLHGGGCAAVICNTVNRAIAVFLSLRNALKDTECLLFHARTLRAWRREREEKVIEKFGKGEKQADGFHTNPRRPGRAVLVATQVIEQSLDLDFDFMVSEIAPIDLLLQRCGRLHRHSRRRPAKLEKPLFVLLCDADTEGPPPESFGKSNEFVYDRHILLRTWLALRKCKRIRLPDEIESLVEKVYGRQPEIGDKFWKDALSESEVQMEHTRRESAKSATRLLVCSPKNPWDLIEEFNHQLKDDEDPQVHKALKAATREGDPSITVVIVAEGTSLSDHPGESEVRMLLERSAKLNHMGIFKILLEEGTTPVGWNKTPHLRHARLIQLDARNQAEVGAYVLTVDECLGIVIEKKGSNNVGIQSDRRVLDSLHRP